MSGRHYAPTSSSQTTSARDSRRSNDSYDHYSYDSRSTAPSSFYGNVESSKVSSSKNPKQYTVQYDGDFSPSTSLYPRSSVETYSSKDSAEEVEHMGIDDIVDNTEIPPLPMYRHEIIDTNVRPSSPEDFAALFPSMDRLSVKHDDFTSDGNMNLRVDTVVSGRRRRTVQLFHLRMYDLNKREFSLRRYCRDSGREVCNSKRKYTESPAPSRPSLQRSMSTAMKSFTRPQLKRSTTGGSTFSTTSRPETSYSADADNEHSAMFTQGLSFEKPQKPRQTATNVIKLEFSNYARVDVERSGSKGSKRYEFAWWGHKYTWKRVTDKLTGVVSFHLFRHGSNSVPVAHIVPETRSPTQVASDEAAGGWIPPCHMWLSDESLIDAATDVADVVIATGLMALVDDCIKQRWSTKHTRPQRIGLPMRSKTADYDQSMKPKSFVQQIFSRRNSDHSSPLRKTYRPVATY